MTNEALLKRLLEIKDTLPENEQGMIDICIKTNCRLTTSTDIVARLTNLILDVRDGITMDCAKKNGVGDKLKAAKRILRSAPDRYEQLKYTYTDASGIQTICNSFCMVRLTEPLDLPELPHNMEVDVKRLMPKQVKPVTIDLPSLGELKAYYKMKKAEKVKVVDYRFGENLPRVDAEMLIDIMTLVPVAVATWEKHGIVFENEQGDYALLLILRD